MRVVGYFPNSHFFNLIQKLVIDEWNDYIEANRGKKDYYILKDISFRNRKTVIERVNQESDGAGVLKYVKSPSNHLEEVGKDVNKERAKIKINKKNYVAREINLNKKVEETFGYEGWVVVTAVFSSLSHEFRFGKKTENKTECAIVGNVVLEKLDKDVSTNANQTMDRTDDVSVDKINNEMKFLTKNPTERNPFNKNKLFKFNPERLAHRKSSFGAPMDSQFCKSTTNLNKIVEDAPYKHNSDKSLNKHRYHEQTSLNYINLDLSRDSNESFKE